MDVVDAVPPPSTSTFASSFQNSSVAPEIYHERIDKLRRILIDGFDVDLTLNFLFKQSHTDLSILKGRLTTLE